MMLPLLCSCFSTACRQACTVHLLCLKGKPGRLALQCAGKALVPCILNSSPMQLGAWDRAKPSRNAVY